MESVAESIESVRRRWGSQLLILGHHYQRASVLAHADIRGDSLELSRAAAGSGAERIVFCGVHFMAESADLLSRPSQAVYMPETLAGCPMANMAVVEDVERAWRFLEACGGGWLPVVYVNSSAAIKACCGRWGGSTCTSSNAARVFEWVRAQGRRVFFLPDEHLGANTAHDFGLPDESLAVYNPRLPDGGLTPAAVGAAQVIVWKGFCIVHQAFQVEAVRRVRTGHPAARIIVHPETPREVVRLCDAHGSTAEIIRYVEQAPAGSLIFVGTELNLVERLAAEHAARGVTVKALAPSVCANMAKTNPVNLLALLNDWPEDCRVVVPPQAAPEARRSLETMLAL